MTEQLLKTVEAGQLLRLSPKTLETWRVRGGGPRFCKLGCRVFYRREDLESWIESRNKASTSDPG